MEWQQAGPGGLDETVSTVREEIGRLTLEAGLNQIESWLLRLKASGVPELEPIADGLARLKDRIGGDDVDAFTAGNVMVGLGGQVGNFASTEAGCAVSDLLEALAGLLKHEGQRLAEAQR